MTKVAVIGLGIMGLPMAKNLVTAGHEVTGYNRSPEKAQELAQAGGTAAGSVAEAVKDAEVIITMVPDSPDVQAVSRARTACSPTPRRVPCGSMRPPSARTWP